MGGHCDELAALGKVPATRRPRLFNADAARVGELKLPPIDYVLTSPPYWDMLRARIYEMELKKREAVAQAEADSKTEIGWGRQIRSYVLHPYTQVTDHRTDTSVGDAHAVLDGGLDPFIDAYLHQQIAPGDDA